MNQRPFTICLRITQTFIWCFGIIFISLWGANAKAALDESTARDVLKIARAIKVVHPRLKEKKYLEYGLGIYRAALKYQIEPSVLIAITQQESAFRPNLPEGKAGERGICQVLKNWLKNPKFRAEFKTASLADFSSPEKSFEFAAWILRDLKSRSKKGTLPYWSYYNANKFHNRFKYFLKVNRYVAALKKNEHLFEDRRIASQDVLDALDQLEKRRTPKPTVLPPLISTASLLPIRTDNPNALKQGEKIQLSVPSLPLYWTPDTVKQLQLKQKAKQVSADLLRATHESDPQELLPKPQSFSMESSLVP